MSTSVTDTITAHLRAALPGEPQRASVTFLGVESIDVLRFVDAGPPADGRGFDAPGDVVFVSVGCARHPMTDPSDLAADPVRGPRAEIVVRMHAGDALVDLHRSVALLAATPSVEGIVLVADALIDLGEPLWQGSRCTAVVLEPADIDDCPLDEPMSAVTFLRAVPITANEAAWVRLRGVDELRSAWAEAGIDVADVRRVSADPGRT